MKIITIVEIVARDFEVETDSAEEVYKTAEQRYWSGEYVPDLGECHFRKIAITKPSNEATGWREF